MVLAAIDAGLDVWSGLHTFIGDDAEFAARAARRGVTVHDLRKPPADLPVATGRVREVDATVILTVGTDCNIGKMTAALQVRDALRARGHAIRFAGTGQTGILIEGWGIAVSLNTFDLTEPEARDAITRACAETGLPTTDPVRFDPAPIADAIAAFHAERVKELRG
jgi:uncharacterized NAD-dependent epimerase/dehydratase family protein